MTGVIPKWDDYGNPMNDAAEEYENDGKRQKDYDDEIHHHQMMQAQYLVWYETNLGGLFSIEAHHSLRQAEGNRDGFVEDGYPARVMKVSVVDGQPVAEWEPTE